LSKPGDFPEEEDGDGLFSGVGVVVILAAGKSIDSIWIKAFHEDQHSLDSTVQRGRRDGLQEMRSQAHGSAPTRYYGAEA